MKHCTKLRGNTAESIAMTTFKDTGSGHRGRTVDIGGSGISGILGGAGD